jgi:hypothetical protein
LDGTTILQLCPNNFSLQKPTTMTTLYLDNPRTYSPSTYRKRSLERKKYLPLALGIPPPINCKLRFLILVKGHIPLHNMRRNPVSMDRSVIYYGSIMEQCSSGGSHLEIIFSAE